MVIETTTAGFERLRSERSEWRKELRERALWDTTTADGLEDA